MRDDDRIVSEKRRKVNRNGSMGYLYQEMSNCKKVDCKSGDISSKITRIVVFVLV